MSSVISTSPDDPLYLYQNLQKYLKGFQSYCQSEHNLYTEIYQGGIIMWKL